MVLLRIKTHRLDALAVTPALQALVDAREDIDEVVYPGLPVQTEHSKGKKKLARRMLNPHPWKGIFDSVYRMTARGLGRAARRSLPFFG